MRESFSVLIGSQSSSRFPTKPFNSLAHVMLWFATTRRRICRGRRRTVWLTGLAAMLLVAGQGSLPGRAASPDPPALRLVDATGNAGINFVHTDGGSGHQYLVELMVAGLALLDYDRDGWIDIYLLNGAPLPGSGNSSLKPPGASNASADQPPPRNALFRNNGNGTFVDVTHAAGVGDTGHGLGVTAADYDNDGDIDLYVNNFGPNVLYRNNGDGTFTDVAAATGVVDGQQVGAGAAFLDIEGDGDIDLYVAHYIDFTFSRHEQLAPRSFPYPPGPRDYPPAPDSLYRNDGNGTFTDVSQTSGVSRVAGPGMGLIAFDYEDDDDTDLFICNDGAANFLLRNDGQGRFAELGLLAGVAYDGRGQANGSMGVDAGDYDNDGRFDLLVTDYISEAPVLYRGLPGGYFEDAAHRSGAAAATFPNTNWGVGLVDFDHDGDRDAFIANGHFLHDIQDIDDGTAYRVRDCLLRNRGDGRFHDATDQAGDGLQVVESSRGAGFDDLDNDGDIDVVVLNANAAPTLLRNESPRGAHWMQIQLRGVQTNRDGTGARVRVVTGDLVQVAARHSGRGYQSHWGDRLHFGLGPHHRVDMVEVRWPGGRSERFEHLPADQIVLLTEGSGTTVSLSFDTGGADREAGAGQGEAVQGEAVQGEAVQGGPPQP